MKPVSLQFFLNHYLDPVEVAKQTKGMAEAGYQAVAGHARAGMLTPYMSVGWWDAIDAIIEVCKETGTRYCIWDEDYYPSGHAGGRVIWNEPELIAGALVFHTAEFTGSGPFELDFDAGMFMGAWAVSEDGQIADVSQQCGTRRQSWTHRRINHGAYSTQVNFVGNPHWRCQFLENKHAVMWTPERPGTYRLVGAIVKPTPNQAPDIMNPKAVRRFIEHSYEPYYERYKELFGSVIDSAFTDEPSPGGMTHPWTPKFREEFVSDHGYDIVPLLPHLALEIDTTTPVVRHHYRKTQHRLLETAYVAQLANWCQQHNIEFTGHLTRTEWLSLTSVFWPNELRTYKEMHVPCCDPLGAACAWPDASSYATGLKVVSSAAHLFGKKQAGSDALAVIGDESKLRDMKFMLDFQMVMGVNAFMLHGASYSLDGPRKDEVPPSLSYHHSEWKYFGALNDYLAKTCEKLTGGEHICKTAVLYPSTTLYCQADPSYNWYSLDDERKFHDFVESLLCRQKDFDLIDEVTLAECTDTEGALNTPERYESLLLAHLRYIDVEAADAIGRCAKYGTKVYVVGGVPKVLGKDPHGTPYKLDTTGMNVVDADDISYIDELYGVTVEGEGHEHIFVLERKTDDGPITFVLNRAECEFSGKIDGVNVKLPGKGSCILQECKQAYLDVGEPIMTLESGWQCKFEHNSVPLNFWHVIEESQMQKQTYPMPPPGVDLMAKEIDPTLGESGKYVYTCRFFLTGKPGNALIVMDKSAVTGDWKLFVNDIEITSWHNGRRFDCLDIEAKVGTELRTGATPTINTLRVECDGADHGLHEVIYLLGDFDCEYRYSHPSSPFLTAASANKTIDSLQDWANLGYPTYSGTALYRVELECPQDGDYVLDLGRVEDIAEVYLDKKRIDALAWEPYRCNLPQLSEGRHLLEVEVTNTLGNRTRNAHLPAGLLGPVKLCKVVR